MLKRKIDSTLDSMEGVLIKNFNLPLCFHHLPVAPFLERTTAE